VKTIRVLVADDHTIVRDGLVALLNSSGDCQVVAQAADGIATVEFALQTRPDVVVLDISMPKLNGIEVVRRLTRELDSARVLVLTMHAEEEYVLHVVRAGAAGFLLKDAPATELVNAVRVVAAGQAVLAPQVTRRLLDEFAHHLGGQPPADPRLGTLTDREREILIAIGRGWTNGEIAERLVLSESTVKTHVGRVLAKIGARDRIQAVILAYDLGLTRPQQPG